MEVLFESIRLGRKWLAGTNTLAYFDTTVKSFIAQVPGSDIIIVEKSKQLDWNLAASGNLGNYKTFYGRKNTNRNKLECPLTSIHVRPSLIFADKARVYPMESLTGLNF